MATDYGGGHGDPPSPGVRLPAPAPAPAPAPGFGSRPAEPPPGDRRPRRSRAGFLIAVTVLVLGLAGLGVALAGVAAQLLPRHFTAAQRQQIISWEYSRRWRDRTAGQIFPAAVRYPPPAALDDDPALGLRARRIGIDRQATCRSGTDPAAAAVLGRDGCAALLAASYTDETSSYVITVGVAVLPAPARAAAAAQSLAGLPAAGGLAPGMRARSFAGTPAAFFTDQRRQLSGAVSAGSYVVLYTAGYADQRPREPLASDSYGDAEMTAAAAGVARAVLSVLAAPVRPPACPGTPGC